MKKNEYAKTLSQERIVQGNIGSVVGERLVLLRVALRCGQCWPALIKLEHEGQGRLDRCRSRQCLRRPFTSYLDGVEERCQPGSRAAGAFRSAGEAVHALVCCFRIYQRVGWFKFDNELPLYHVHLTIHFWSNIASQRCSSSHADDL